MWEEGRRRRRVSLGMKVEATQPRFWYGVVGERRGKAKEGWIVVEEGREERKVSKEVGEEEVVEDVVDVVFVDESTVLVGLDAMIFRYRCT